VTKRVLLFLATNLAILLMVSVVLAVLGALGILPATGGQGVLLVYCAVWGFGASFASLLMSRWIAKRATGVRLVDGRTGNADADWLHNTVGNLARQANLPMPEVGIYDAPEVNAFATGPSKKRSLVAVSTGLLRSMDRNEVEGVLAHEISHIANGDMVTMALVQGVVNTFVMFFARVLAQILDQFLRDDRGRGGLGFFGYFIAITVLEGALFMLAWPIIAAFSRWREFRADRGSAQVTSPGTMIHALESLARNSRHYDKNDAALATLKIQGGGGGLWAKLISTHPPIAARIEALRRAA
jgi:heat shock protein HtpX